MRLCILRVLWCSVCFCTGHFVTVPINLTCPHCLQHFVFEHLFHLYYLFHLYCITSMFVYTCITRDRRSHLLIILFTIRIVYLYISRTLVVCLFKTFVICCVFITSFYIGVINFTTVNNYCNDNTQNLLVFYRINVSLYPLTNT